MNTEHILIYPHKEYNLHNKFANTLKPNEVVNYGYIKRRNLSKWENDEVVAVKMGMLTPSKKSYFEKTIKDAVVLRIENQDNESCFDDDDELIPVYIFVSTERDDEWRKYLHTRGFNSARKDKKREGILIKKSDIGLHYGKHYNIDTKEVLCEKERIAEEKRKLKEQKEREKKAKAKDITPTDITYENKITFETTSTYTGLVRITKPLSYENSSNKIKTLPNNSVITIIKMGVKYTTFIVNTNTSTPIKGKVKTTELMNSCVNVIKTEQIVAR